MLVAHAVRVAVVVSAFLIFGAAQADDRSTTRIVSLVPALTEITYAIGAGEQLVGVSQFCLYPLAAKSKPKAGGLVNPSLERVVALRPDIVFLYRSQADFAAKLSMLRVKPHLYDLDRLEDTWSVIDAIGRLTGEVGQATALRTSLQEKLEDIRARASSRSPVRAMVVVSRDPTTLRNIYQAGPGNFLGELLMIAGGSHAVPGGAPVSVEDIVRANPEVIIDMSGAEAGEQSGGEKQALEIWARLSTVSAVRAGRVHYLLDPHALVPGPYLPEIAGKFEKMLSVND